MATPKDLWATPRYGACSTCTCGCVWICHVRMCDPLHRSYVPQACEVCPQVLSCNHACVRCKCQRVPNGAGKCVREVISLHNKANKACNVCERWPMRMGGRPIQCAHVGAIVGACGRRECEGRASGCGPTRGMACVRVYTRRGATRVAGGAGSESSSGGVAEHAPATSVRESGGGHAIV